MNPVSTGRDSAAKPIAGRPRAWIAASSVAPGCVTAAPGPPAPRYASSRFDGYPLACSRARIWSAVRPDCWMRWRNTSASPGCCWRACWRAPCAWEGGGRFCAAARCTVTTLRRPAPSAARTSCFMSPAFPKGVGNRAQNMLANRWPVKGLKRAAAPGLNGLEEAGDRDEATIHGIGSQPEAFEREHTEDRFGTWLTEYDDRGLRALADPDLHPRHRVSDLATVSQNERPFLFRHRAQADQHVTRDPRIRGTRIHERFDGLEALAGPVADLDSDPEVAHARIWRAL